jgi:hypothetical protein
LLLEGLKPQTISLARDSEMENRIERGINHETWNNSQQKFR